ncbi:MAG: NADH-quinone oxidoreductase subunit C [Chloroflexota bacterium]|nr:NADH-quinone oxidoreductase subunit C [Chloroflexota bacterium]
MNCIKVSKEDYLRVAKSLKEKGFQRLLTISAVDWIEEETYEVYFVVHKLDENAYVKVAARIPRDDPQIPSLSKIWPNAAMHEREPWELFGIDFNGNEMLKPLFLEDWVGPPPFRKDFNWREYAKEEFNLPQAGGED